MMCDQEHQCRDSALNIPRVPQQVFMEDVPLLGIEDSNYRTQPQGAGHLAGETRHTHRVVKHRYQVEWNGVSSNWEK